MAESHYKNERAQEIARHMMKAEGTASVWGLAYEDGGVGWAKVSMVVKPDMLNGHQTLHGGLIFALADTAFAYACNSYNQAAVSQQASISYLRPVVLGQKITATATELGKEGRSGSYEVIITDADQRIIATFQGLSRIVRGHILNEEN